MKDGPHFSGLNSIQQIYSVTAAYKNTPGIQKFSTVKKTNIYGCPSGAGKMVKYAWPYI